MTINNYVFVLGAKDPEMDMIEDRIIKPLGLQFEYAAIDGKRCHPGNAYLANNDINGDLAFIECGIEGVEGMKVDYHRPGDPGYGVGPEDFLNASSLGQMVKLALGNAESQIDYFGISRTIGGRPNSTFTGGDSLFYDGLVGLWVFPSSEYGDTILPSDFMYQAAADHCLAAGYAGKCPGVDKEGLRALQARNMSKTTNVTVEEALDKIQETEKMFTYGRLANLGDSEHVVADFSDLELGVGYSLPYLALKEAGTMMGKAYLVSHKFSEGAPKTLMLNSATEDEVNYFMQEFAPSKGLERIFGSPSRGYAGGNLSE